MEKAAEGPFFLLCCISTLTGMVWEEKGGFVFKSRSGWAASAKMSQNAPASCPVTTKSYLLCILGFNNVVDFFFLSLWKRWGKWCGFTLFMCVNGWLWEQRLGSISAFWIKKLWDFRRGLSKCSHGSSMENKESVFPLVWWIIFNSKCCTHTCVTSFIYVSKGTR